MKKLTKEDRSVILKGLLSQEPSLNAVAVMVVGDYLDFLESTVILLKRGYQTIAKASAEEPIRLIAEASIVVCEETLYEDVTI